MGEILEDSAAKMVQVLVEKEKVNCPYYGSPRLYGRGLCKPRRALHSWHNSIILNLKSGNDGELAK